ncbi:MAG: hypothetical protein R2873_05300 [Caldilineaceae bacterium]
MSFLKKIFGSTKLDGDALAQSAAKEEYAQIDLLSRFVDVRSAHSTDEIRLWDRVLPRPYAQQIELFQKQGWLSTGDKMQVTAAARPFVDTYQRRQENLKQQAMHGVRKAIAQKDTSEALDIRRRYEAAQPLGKAQWTGPEPQMSHSALTRRILFLDHWLLDGISPSTAQWLKYYAAEQHMWGAHWRLSPADLPAEVAAELASPEMDAVEAAYWRAYQLALYVDNQETWQRCKGGDHVRRIEITGPDDEYTCEHCKPFIGQQYLVARVPELPHRECTSARGCRCVYSPVLETYEE